MTNIIQENQLYTDATTRAALVADKKLCMDALLINFFGFLGLFKLSDSRGPMKNYETTEGKLFLQHIGDTNHDVSLSVKLAFEAGLITMPAVNSMTKLLVLIKNKTVKAATLQEKNIRDILDQILYKSHQPSAVVLSDITRFHSGAIGIGELAKELYTLVRTNKHLQPITVEFRNLVMKGQYGDFFSKMGKPVAVAAPVVTPPAVPAQIAAPAHAPTVVPVTAPAAPATISHVASTATPAATTPIKVIQYVNTTAGHNKFWAGGVHGSTLYTVWGPIGHTPQKNSKPFPDAAAANAALALLKREKVNKGYRANANMTIYADGAAGSAPAHVPAVVPTNVPKPVAPVVQAAPQIRQGATSEFFKNLLTHAYDGANMNNVFRDHGVAKSTLNLSIFYQWVQAHSLSVEEWRQKAPGIDYDDIPLIKHIKTLSGYKYLNYTLASSWVINSIKYALMKRDAGWLLNSMNVNSFYKIVQGDEFGHGLPYGSSAGFGARTKLKSDYAQSIVSLLMDHLKAALRAAKTPDQLTQAVVDMKRWQAINRHFGNGLFIQSNMGNSKVEWTEPGVTGAQLKLYIAAGYYNGTANTLVPIKFSSGLDEGLLLQLKKEVRSSLQGQLMLNAGRLGFSSMTMSTNVLKSLDPGVQDAIKLLQQMPDDATKNFFKVVEGDNIEATIKELADATSAKELLAAVENSSYSSVFTSEFENSQLKDTFGAPDDEIEKLFHRMYKMDGWIRQLWVKAISESRRNELQAMLTSHDETRVKAAKFIVRTLMEAMKDGSSQLGPESDRAMNFMLLMIETIAKKSMPGLAECDKAAMIALKKSPELNGKLLGLSQIGYADSYGNTNANLTTVRRFLSGHDEYIQENPEGIGFWLLSQAALPHGGVNFASAQKFRDTMSLIYNIGLTLRNVEDRPNDLKHAAELVKHGIDKFGWQFVMDYQFGGGPAGHSPALATICFFSAILGGTYATNFASAMKTNKETVGAGLNGLPASIKMILNGMHSYLQNKIVEVNKPMMRAIFDLAKDNKVQLNNAGGLYLKTLTKDEVIKQLETGELKTMILAGRASKDVLDGLAENTVELADTAPKATIGMFDLVEDLFKDKRTYDKSMRDSLTDKMSSHLFDIHRTNPKVANTIFMAVKGELKRSLLDRATGEALIKTLDTHLYGDASLVKPLQKITPERVKELLKYNSVSIGTIRINSPAGKSISALEAEITKTANAMVAPKVIHTPSKLAAKDKTAYLERKSVEYAAFQNYRHGDIALRFLDEFDVDIAQQVKAYSKWVTDHPGTQIMKQVFHGTGSIAATFILRFGFAIVKAGDPSCTGRMLGDGIYFSNVLDKATQYIGDSGFSRRVGLKGYILECESALGTRGVNYQAAGDGQNMNHIRSPEWCVREKAQLKINKAFLVEMIDKATMVELQKKHAKAKNEGVIMKITTFKDFIKESATPGKQVVTYSFRDGHIPISETEYRDFQNLDGVTFPPNTILEPSAYGPMLSIECDEPESEGFVVANTSEFMQDTHELQKFLRLAYNK